MTAGVRAAAFRFILQSLSESPPVAIYRDILGCVERALVALRREFAEEPSPGVCCVMDDASGELIPGPGESIGEVTAALEWIHDLPEPEEGSWEFRLIPMEDSPKPEALLSAGEILNEICASWGVHSPEVARFLDSDICGWLSMTLEEGPVDCVREACEIRLWRLVCRQRAGQDGDPDLMELVARVIPALTEWRRGRFLDLLGQVLRTDADRGSHAYALDLARIASGECFELCESDDRFGPCVAQLICDALDAAAI
jgi:hypothetical protein